MIWWLADFPVDALVVAGVPVNGPCWLADFPLDPVVAGVPVIAGVAACRLDSVLAFAGFPDGCLRS